MLHSALKLTTQNNLAQNEQGLMKVALAGLPLHTCYLDNLTSSRPIRWDGIPLIAERVSCFAETCQLELSPFLVLQPLHRLTPLVLRLKHFWQH